VSNEITEVGAVAMLDELFARGADALADFIVSDEEIERAVKGGKWIGQYRGTHGAKPLEYVQFEGKIYVVQTEVWAKAVNYGR
jgi:hypothetical protein